MSNDPWAPSGVPPQQAQSVQVPQPLPAVAAPVNRQEREFTPESVQEAKRLPRRQARDGAQYVRQQKGHSLTLHLIFGMLVLWVNVIYISVSPNHYWHV